jgi:hypothetical protein
MFLSALLRRIDGDIIVTGESRDITGGPNRTNAWVTMVYHKMHAP